MSIIGAGRQSSSSAIRKLRGHSFSGTDVFTYKESLDTTYVGGYIGFGGEYSLGFLSTGGLMNRLGLRTFINAKAGLYNADTDYDGNFAFNFFPFNSKLSQSNDDLAFHRQRVVRDAQTIGSAHQSLAVDRLRVHLVGS